MPSSTGSPLNANRTGTSVTAVIARVAGPLDTARSMFPRLSSDTTSRSACGLPGA